ncbi:MAG: methyltransferase domain-containing protein [Chloroflexi bacterium]|nr:methyltransferase domain-containing protein [Chloroflexota bacterium]
MTDPISSRVWNNLICSYCGHGLEKIKDGAECTACGLQYKYTKSGALDLRLQRPKNYPLDFELGTPLLPNGGFQFDPLQTNPAPEVDFSGVSVPRHLTKEILSYFPRAKSKDSLMLDLGCGDAIHKQISEHAGFEWVGLDYEAPNAQILGDAHMLPFKDKTFDFILCITVMQYVRFPFVMMREINRVLKPGGKLIGTVAFLEPSHGTSFYHHSHLGAHNLLRYGGLTVERLAPSETWSSLKAQASMGMFFKMPRALAQAIVFPLELLHKLWWLGGSLVTRKPLENTRIRHFTGSFTFVASKPAE